jgi:hypothetical protein
MFNWIKQIINESMVEFSDSLDIPEQPFRYNLFYKDDLTTYSTIEIEYKFRWNKLRIALSRFIEKYPLPKITNIIHIIERNRDNEPNECELELCKDNDRSICRKHMLDGLKNNGNYDLECTGLEGCDMHLYTIKL